MASLLAQDFAKRHLPQTSAIVVLLLMLTVVAVSSARDEKPQGSHDPRGLSMYFANELMIRVDFGHKNGTNEPINYVISPVSIHNGLALLYKGTSHRDKLIFEAILTKKRKYHIDSLSDYVKSIQKENNFSNKNSSVKSGKQHSSPKDDHSLQLDFWSLIWLGNNLKINPEYEQVAKNKYLTKVVTNDNNDLLEDINKWAKDKGFNGNVVNSSHKPQDGGLTLFTALSIKGFWQDKFEEVVDSKFFHNYKVHNKKHTKYAKNLTVLKSLRHQVKYIFKDKEFTAVDIPLKGHNDTSLSIIMPGERFYGLDDLFEFYHSQYNHHSTHRDYVISILDHLSEAPIKEANLTIPSFRIDNEIDLRGALEQLNLMEFVQDRKFLNKITTSSHGISIVKAEHNAFIEVNKQGLRAAAITIFGGVELVPPPKDEIPKIEINNPFLFYVRQNGIILFSGHVVAL